MRLTKRYSGGVVMSVDAEIRDVLKKLAAYEDAEEQGRLVILPCKVGDTGYCVWQAAGICPYEVDKEESRR